MHKSTGYRKFLNKDQLVAYFPFNNNCLDVSPNGMIGSVYGATITTDRLGNPNSAYQFNGENDYIEIDDNRLKTERGFTISFWMKADQFDQVILTNNYSENSENYGAMFKMNENGLVGFGYGGGGFYLNKETIAGEWYHVLGILYENGYPRIYINGEYQTGGLFVTRELLYDDGKFTIGRVAGKYFKGAIDDLVVFSRVLDVYEIRSSYHLNSQ